MTELEKFQNDFVWEADKVDGWSNLDGEWPRGDCDDYAVSVALILAGSRLKFWLGILTLRFVFWLVRLDNGKRHVALRVRGYGWTDSARMPWSDTCPHRKIMPFLPPFVLVKMLVGKVFN